MQTVGAANSHGGSGLVYATALFVGSDVEMTYWRVKAKMNGKQVAAQMSFVMPFETPADQVAQAYADQVFAQLDRKPIFPVAAKANDELSRTASELWRLMRLQSQEYAEASAYGAPSECNALINRVFHNQALEILKQHGFTVDGFCERLDAVVDYRYQYFRMPFGSLLFR